MVRPEDFQKLAMPHLGSAYRLAHALLRSTAEAEDAVQDGFLRAFRALHQFKGDAFKPWFLTIVRNVCYRRLQQRKRSSNVISLDEALAGRPGADDFEWQPASDAPSPEDRAVMQGESTRLQRILADMPPALREVLQLREVEELSYQAISAVIGAPVGTIMSRLSRARSELQRRYLAQENVDSKNAV